MMLTPENLHPYQNFATSHIIEQPHSMLWLEMGLGKTISTLSAIVELQNRLEIWGTLVVAPLRVCQSVWRQEARKWSHTQHLTFSLITGTKRDRQRALFTKADVYLINYDNLEWLTVELEARWLSKGRYLPFNMVVWDEVSKLKNTRIRQGVNRGKAALKILPYIHRRVGLTGTPASNGLLDLFGQYLVVDGGERLGSSFEKYKEAYFYQADWNGYRFNPFPGADEKIQGKIGDITITMKNDDYLDLPPFVFNEIELEMPSALQKRYKAMEKEFFLEFDSGHQLGIENEASLTNRCLQFASGACYMQPGAPEWEEIHKLKIEALEDVVEEAAGSPILVLYQFIHDAHRIKKKFKDAVLFHSTLPEDEFNDIVGRWNRGEIRLLVGHPASIGHGLNIQAGSNTLVWFGLNWSLDLYDQANARLRRQGQTKPVIVNRIIMKHTMDEAQRLALQMKAEEESGIRDAIARYRAEE